MCALSIFFIRMRQYKKKGGGRAIRKRGKTNTQARTAGSKGGARIVHTMRSGGEAARARHDAEAKRRDGRITDSFRLKKERARKVGGARREMGVEFDDACRVTSAPVGSGLRVGDRIAAVDGDASASPIYLVLLARTRGRWKTLSVERARAAFSAET